MKTCYDCKYRVVDTYNGDRCGKGDFTLMDSRFKYEYEIFKLQNGRPCYCLLKESEDSK